MAFQQSPLSHHELPQFHPYSETLPPLNALRLSRNNAHYIEPYEPDNDVLERSLSSHSSSFVWPTGTIVITPLKS